MTKISLITPMRGQHDLFENLMATLQKNTANPSDIEVLICLDEDDKQSTDRINEWKDKYSFINLDFLTSTRSEHFTKDYVNALAREARGRFVMNINVDSEFVTPNWDEIIYDDMARACEQAGDDFFLGLVKDGLVRHNEDKLYPNFSCWPIVSKKSIDCLGYFLDERFKIWGPDHFIAIPYRRLNRLVSLTHVKIDHNSVHAGRRKDDGNFTRFHEIDRQNPFVVTEEVIQDAVNQLWRCISEQHNQ